MVEVEWIDELPGQPIQRPRGFYTPRGDSQDLHDHAAELIKHPMRWSRYPRDTTGRRARTIANALQEGSVAAYSPRLGFEAVCRGKDIYVRHNPDCVAPSARAFLDGYRKGVRDTVDRVRDDVTRLRELLAEIESVAVAARRPELTPLLTQSVGRS